MTSTAWSLTVRYRVEQLCCRVHLTAPWYGIYNTKYIKPPTHNTKFVIIYTKVGGKPSSLSLASTFMLVDDTLFVDTRCCFNFVIMLCTVLDKLDQYLPHVSRCVYINIYIYAHIDQYPIFSIKCGIISRRHSPHPTPPSDHLPVSPSPTPTSMLVWLDSRGGDTQTRMLNGDYKYHLENKFWAHRSREILGLT